MLNVYLPVPLITGVALVYILSRQKPVFDLFSTTLPIIGLYGLAIGLLRGNNMRYVVPDMARILFVLAAYTFTMNLRPSTELLRTILRRLSAVLFWAYLVVMAFFYVVSIPLGWTVRLGLGTYPLLLPVAYYYWTKKRWRFFAAVLIMLLSSKRGDILSLFVMLVAMLFIPRTRRLWRLIVAVAVAGSLLVGIFLGGIYAVYPYVEGTRLQLAFDKWLAFVPWSSDFNLYVGSAGRVTEILSALRELCRIPLGLLGGGHGFSYTFSSERVAEWNVAGWHNVHCSPVSVFVVYGLPMTLVFFGLLLYLLAKAYRFLPREKDPVPVEMILFSFVAGSLATSLFAFSLLQDPLLWIFLGALTALASLCTKKMTTGIEKDPTYVAQ